MKKNKKLSALYINIFILICAQFIFLFHAFSAITIVETKPKKSKDPFIEMRNKIKDFDTFIKQKEEDKSCYHLFGKDIMIFYKSQNTPLEKLLKSTETEIGSKSYKENIDDVDDEIYALVKQFSVNKQACNEKKYFIAKNKLSEILTYRDTLLQKTQSDNSPLNQYKKENDKTDPGFFTFTKTAEEFKNFTTKIDLIVKAVKDLKEGEISPEYNFVLTKEERKKINDRAKQRADSYSDEFIESAQDYLYTPILRSYENVKKDLESLPNGKSSFDKFTYTVDFKKIVSDMLSPNAKKEAITALNKNKKTIDNFRTVFHENSIYINKLIQKENEEYKENLEDMMQFEEYISKYDQPFSNAVVESLIPFHITLIETERLLNYQTENLKYVLNRQNVEVE